TAAHDRKSIVGLQTAMKTTREQWKKEAEKKDGAKIPEEIRKQADELQKKTDEIAKKYHREREGLGNAGPPFEWRPEPLPNQVSGLLEDLDDFSAAPSPQQVEKLAELKPQVSQGAREVKQLVEEDLPALNKKMNDLAIPHIVIAGNGGQADGGDEEDDR
ncbi:MAG TPA: hypothetical protein VF758_00625, partial [Candidatus Acidoferrum sp.]